MAKALSKKKVDALIQKFYGKYAQGKQINIFKISKVFQDAQAAIVAAQPVGVAPRQLTEGEVGYVLDTVMPVIVAKYCEAV